MSLVKFIHDKARKLIAAGASKDSRSKNEDVEGAKTNRDPSRVDIRDGQPAPSEDEDVVFNRFGQKMAPFEVETLDRVLKRARERGYRPRCS